MNTVAIATGAWEKAQQIYSVITHPIAQWILSRASQALLPEWTIKDLLPGPHSAAMLRHHLKLLTDHGLLRRERIGNEYYYKLSHGRIETINAAAARLL